MVCGVKRAVIYPFSRMALKSWALAVLSVYSIVITIQFVRKFEPKLNSICSRDHVDPTAEGSCLCGANKYCLCTPNLASDILIEVEPEGSDPGGIVFIVRGDGRGLAMVGGFVRVGESAEDAARREALEETGLQVQDVRQFCMFSSPTRDPRRHTSAMVYVARARGKPRAADDAKGVRTIPVQGALARHSGRETEMRDAWLADASVREHVGWALTASCATERLPCDCRAQEQHAQVCIRPRPHRPGVPGALPLGRGCRERGRSHRRGVPGTGSLW